MAGSSKDIIDSLIAKFHAMSDLCKAFENENGILKEQLMHQKQEMQALQSKYEELEEKIWKFETLEDGLRGKMVRVPKKQKSGLPD